MLKSLRSSSQTVAAIVLALWALQFVTGTPVSASKPRTSLTQRAIAVGKQSRKRDIDLLGTSPHFPEAVITPGIPLEPR